MSAVFHCSPALTTASRDVHTLLSMTSARTPITRRNSHPDWCENNLHRISRRPLLMTNSSPSSVEDPLQSAAGTASNMNGILRLNRGRLLLLLLLSLVVVHGQEVGPIVFAVQGANAAEDDELKWRPAVELILSAFRTHSIVALSEGTGHGQLATRDFFIALIHDSRFPSTIRNIVIEFGNARYQTVMDR